MRCDQCKFWDRSDNHSLSYGLGLGVCAATRMFWDATEWSADDDGGRKFTEADKGVLAFTQDASDYRADLLTAPNFGCVQFQAAGEGIGDG